MPDKQPIYIKFPQGAGAGGPATFMGNLQRYLERQGVVTAAHPDEARVIFFPIKFKERVLRRMRARGGAVIQRLDGVHYESKHGPSELWRNEPAKKAYQNFVDFVVFQSEFSRKSCFVTFGDKPGHEYTLIYNGADTSIFYPGESAGRFSAEEPVRFITTGCYRTIDTLEPMVLALDELSQTVKVELVVVGPIRDTYSKNFDPTPLLRRSYIRHVEESPLAEVAELLRQSHVYLYTNLNPPCPNAVIEAVSSGLPVVGFQTGSMPELVPTGCDLLAPVPSTELFHKYEHVDYRLLRDKMTLVIDQYDGFRQRALDNCKLHDFEKCGARYLEVLREWLARTPLKRPGLTARIRELFARKS